MTLENLKVQLALFEHNASGNALEPANKEKKLNGDSVAYAKQNVKLIKLRILAKGGKIEKESNSKK